MDAICEHLQAVSAGQIKKLIINVPPGMAKSSLVACLWPVWEWTYRPGLQWMFATYANNLTHRDAARRRDIINSEWYKARWGKQVEITKEGIEFIKNSKQGHMFSTSTGGQTTGWRGDRLCVAKGTRIATTSGSICIEDLLRLKPPPLILTWNHKENRLEYRKLLSSGIRASEKGIVAVETIRGCRFECTEDHPIFTSRFGYRAASLLDKGETCFALPQTPCDTPQVETDAVSVVERIREKGELVYDLTVEGNHNFFANGILVHNCLDDPQDPKGAESDIRRESTIEWLTRTWPTRVNLGSAVAGQVLIQQRLHQNDATGLYLKMGGFEHLKIPLQWKGKSFSNSRYTDPRTVAGQIIDERIYPAKETEELIRTLGPYGEAGQLDQEPSPLGGGIIKRAWINHYEKKEGWIVLKDFRFRSEDCFRFCVVDPAVTEKDTKNQSDPDYTVISAWCVFPATRGVYLVLLDLLRERLEGPDVLARMKAVHDHWNFNVIGVESIAYQMMLFQTARRKGLPVREISQKEDALFRLDRDKVSRAYSATPLMADGRFFVPEYAPWLAEYIAELVTFPNADHDDQIDVTAAAVSIASEFKERTWAEPPKPIRVRKDQGYNDPDVDTRSDPMDGFKVKL